jgi:hypothetical protein
MISLARLVLETAEAGRHVLPGDLDRIPAFQWDVYFDELAPLCPSRVQAPLLRRPANALNVEPVQPLPRCTLRQPAEWKGRGASALRWLASGGSPLVFGLCSCAGCPRANPRAGEGA